MNKTRSVFSILVIVLVISGCLQTPTDDLAQAVQAKTAELPTASPAASLSAADIPATQTPAPASGPASLGLGQPSWIGRGKIRDAVFLSGARQVAIAWGSGVSLHTVENGQELWYQSTPTNLIAFDVQPQAQSFAAALSDGSVVIYKASDGEPRRFEGARPNAYWGDLAWSPDGQTIAFQFIGPNRSDPIYLLDAASEQISDVPNSQTGEGVIPVLIWSPDGLSITVASLGEDCPRFVDVQSGELRMSLGQPGQCYPIPPLLFLPDGQTLAVGGLSGGLEFLGFPDGERLQTLQSTGDGLVGRMFEFPAASGSLLVDSSGHWIASRGGYEPCYCGSPEDQPDHPLIVWDLARGVVQAQLSQVLEPLAQRHRLAASFDGESILVLYESGEITRWAFSDPQARETVVARLPAQPVSAWTMRWSADGSHLAFTGSYGGVDLYTTATQQLVRRFSPPLYSPAISPDGSLVALYDPDKSAEVIYEAQSGRLLQTLPASPVLMGAAFSPDGQFLAYAANPNALVAELASGEVTMLETSAVPAVTAEMFVSRLIWSPDGQALVTMLAEGSPGSGGPGVIVLWQRQANGSFEAIYHVANVQANYTLPNQVLAIFNPSGSRVALESLPKAEAGQVKLVVYDLQAGNVIRTFEEYTPGAWMNDEELLAAEAQYDTRLTRINVVSGEKMIGNGRDNGDNSYAPGGVFTAQMAMPPLRGVTVKYWRSNAMIAYGEHESLNLLDYCWSPDSRWLASVGDDGTLRLWSVVMP